MKCSFFLRGVTLSICLLIPSFQAEASRSSPNANGDRMELRLPLDPDLRTGRLSNGFTYYIRKRTESDMPLQLRLVVRAGYAQEASDQLALSHLLEHLVVDSGGEVPRLLAANGVGEVQQKTGANTINGSTSVAWTSYKLELPAGRPELQSLALQIGRIWAHGLKFDNGAIRAESGAVIAEGGFADRSFRAWQQLVSEVLSSPKYPPNPIERYTRSLQTFQRASLERFYRDWYRPDLQALVIVGDVDVSAIEAEIKARFSDLEIPESPKGAQEFADRYSVPLSGRNRFAAAYSSTARSANVRIFSKTKIPYFGVRTEQDYRFKLIDQLYNVMIRQRIYARPRRPGEPPISGFTEISNENATFGKTPLLTILEASLQVYSPSETEGKFKSVIRTVEQARRYGFSISELEAAKALLNRDTPQHLTRELASIYQAHFAEHTAAMAPTYEVALRRRILNDIRPADVSARLRTLFHPKRDFDIAILAPEEFRKAMPSELDYRRWVAEVENEQLLPYLEPPPPPQVIMSAEEMASLTPGKIARTGEIAELGVADLFLANGVRVLIKPDNSMGKVHLNGFRPGGLALYSPHDRPSGEAAGDLAIYAGAGGLSGPDISALTRARDISLNMSISPDMTNVSAQASPENLETLMQLVTLFQSSPRRDPIAFAQWKSDKLSTIAWQSRHRNSFAEFVARGRNGDQGGGSANLMPAQVASVNFARAQAIYRENFLDTGNFTYVISGAIDADAAKALAVKYLGALPSSGSRARRISPDRPKARSIARSQSGRKTLYSSAVDSADVAMFFTGTLRDDLMNQIKLEILGAAIQFRIYDRLRRHEGAYSPTSRTQLEGSINNEATYSFTVNFSCAPENVERLIAAAREEFAIMAREGVNESEYRFALSEVQKSPIFSQLSNGGWIRLLRDFALRGEDPTWVLKRQTILTHIVTPTIINHAAHDVLSKYDVMEFVQMPKVHEPGKRSK